MPLPGPQAHALTTALCAAFPSRADLARLVAFGLSENLNTINQGANLIEDGFALVQWADAQGKLSQLLAAARQANPAFQVPGSPLSFRPPLLPETFVARPVEYTKLREAILSGDPAQPVVLTTTL